MSSRVTSITYAVCAWLLAALSVVHMVTTWRLQNASLFTRVWFFGTGIAMAQTAALNLLNRGYGRTVLGLRWTARAFNLVMLPFAVVAGIVSGASTGELVVMLGILTALFLLSLTATAYQSP